MRTYKHVTALYFVHINKYLVKTITNQWQCMLETLNKFICCKDHGITVQNLLDANLVDHPDCVNTLKPPKIMDCPKIGHSKNELFISFLFWWIAGGAAKHFYR